MKKQRLKIFPNIISAISNRLKGKICLEIGCGSGRYLIPISEYCKIKKINFIGLDILNYFNSIKLDFNIIIGDAHNLPVINNSIDSIYMIQSLHQFTDWHLALDEIKRVQRIGRYLLIHTLSQENLKEVIILNIVPEALAIELIRFPKINDIVTYCESIGYKLVEEEKIYNLKIYSRNDLQDFLETRENSALENLFENIGAYEYNKIVNRALKKLDNKISFTEAHNSTLITFLQTQ